MDETKSVFLSKGVWGGVLALVAAIAGIAGYVINAEDVQSLSELIPEILSAVGGVIAIFGRIVATKKLT